ncbi:DUF2721 domain-containing protein [Bacteroidetes/Chlorobi group bacterium MS-B_bin-24]|jgi:hypothetical protein|nr:MAG: DUF2721 domain-containing protein [Bacteroidetes/Chlorobi group bacterium MS-B_bin-24]
MKMSPSIAELIQTMLAPGVMVSACSLMLLVTNNKYSAVVDRIRQLNEEKRDLSEGVRSNLTNEQVISRLESVKQQLDLFERRIPFIVRAVLSYTIAIALYVLTSLLIGFSYAFHLDLRAETFVIFLLGMFAVVIGSIYLAREIIWGYKIALVEIKSS